MHKLLINTESRPLIASPPPPQQRDTRMTAPATRSKCIVRCLHMPGRPLSLAGEFPPEPALLSSSPSLSCCSYLRREDSRAFGRSRVRPAPTCPSVLGGRAGGPGGGVVWVVSFSYFLVIGLRFCNLIFVLSIIFLLSWSSLSLNLYSVYYLFSFLIIFIA